MNMPPFKPLYEKMREAVREKEAAEQQWRTLTDKVRSSGGRFAEYIDHWSEQIKKFTWAIDYIGGSIGTVDAELHWRSNVEPAGGFEVEFTSPEPKKQRFDRPHAKFSKLVPGTNYTGFIRLVDDPKVVAPFGFATRSVGVCGYISQRSVLPGEEFDLYLSSEVPNIKASLRRLVNTDEILGSWDIESPPYHYAPYHAGALGCGWQPTMRISVPADARPDLYLLYLESAVNQFVVPVIVRSPAPPEVAFVCSTDTWNAYNRWGGHSLYISLWEPEERRWVSHHRPNPYANPYGPGIFHLLEAESHVLKHLARNGVTYGVYSDDDLVAGRLEGCKTVVLAGHNEYWCKEKVEEFDRLQAAGVNVLCLSGNTMFRRIVRDRLRDGFSRYGYYTAEEVSPRLGAIYTGAGRETMAPYVVREPEHWIFEGTNVKAGDRFGTVGHSGLLGSSVETDKVNEFSPQGVAVVAKGENPENSGADWVVFRHKNGGLVVNAGSISVGLNVPDPVIDRMVWNVLRYLGHIKSTEYAR
jgi:hypothetical protein